MPKKWQPLIAKILSGRGELLPFFVLLSTGQFVVCDSSRGKKIERENEVRDSWIKSPGILTFQSKAIVYILRANPDLL